MEFKVRKDLEAPWYKLWIAIELNLSSSRYKWTSNSLHATSQALSTKDSRAISIN